MRLKRRFDWMDRGTTYKRVNEDEVERAQGGMIRFNTIDTLGNAYEGAAFETTVYEMTKFEYWRLSPNPKKPEKSIVVQTQPNFTQSSPDSESTSTPSGVTTTTKPKAKRS